MAWRCSGASNEELIQNLARAHLITNTAVKTAMLAVDRGHFSKYKPYEVRYPIFALFAISTLSWALDDER